MQCLFCQQPIPNFDARIHELALGEGRTVTLCSDCIQKFLKWQQGLFATFFPTKAAKKWKGKGEQQ